jgi:hypothetical protein
MVALDMERSSNAPPAEYAPKNESLGMRVLCSIPRPRLNPKTPTKVDLPKPRPRLIFKNLKPKTPTKVDLQDPHKDPDQG